MTVLANSLADELAGAPERTVAGVVVRQGLAGGAIGFGLGLVFAFGPLIAGILVGGSALALLQATHPEAEAPVLQFGWIATTAALGAVAGRATRDMATFA